MDLTLYGNIWWDSWWFHSKVQSASSWVTTFDRRLRNGGAENNAVLVGLLKGFGDHSPRHIFVHVTKLRGAWYNGNCQVHLLMISLEEGRCVQLICKVHLNVSDQIVRTRHFMHNYTTTWLVVSWSSDCKCLRKTPIYANSKEKSYISVNKLFAMHTCDTCTAAQTHMQSASPRASRWLGLPYTLSTALLLGEERVSDIIRGAGESLHGASHEG